MNWDELEDGELRRVAQRLGERAGERLDVERAASLVTQRLRERPRAGFAFEARTWLSLAATLVVIVGAGLVWQRERLGGFRARQSDQAAGFDLKGLSTNQLRDVLQTIDQMNADSVSADPGLDDLTAPELTRLLRTLEG